MNMPRFFFPFQGRRIRVQGASLIGGRRTKPLLPTRFRVRRHRASRSFATFASAALSHSTQGIYPFRGIGAHERSRFLLYLHFALRISRNETYDFSCDFPIRIAEVRPAPSPWESGRACTLIFLSIARRAECRLGCDRCFV